MSYLKEVTKIVQAKRQLALNKKLLDELYDKFSCRSLVFPDPVSFLYRYDDLKDKEVVGLIASSLAYGRVEMINKTVNSVLEKMLPSPYLFLMEQTPDTIYKAFNGFKYRFTTDIELSMMLVAIKNILQNYSTLENCFTEGLKSTDETIFPALTKFINILMNDCNVCKNSLLPLPQKGSACKRQNLFLRWMIRQDNVDPGGWNKNLSPKLIMPIDIHIHRFALEMGLTRRKNADMYTAIEVTEHFRALNPDDPLKYDFVIQKSSILSDKMLLKVLKAK